MKNIYNVVGLVQNGYRVVVEEPIAELIALLTSLTLKLKLWRYPDDSGCMLIIRCEIYGKFGVKC